MQLEPTIPPRRVRAHGAALKSCPKAPEHVLEKNSCCQMPMRSRLWNSALKMPLNPASSHRSRCFSILEGCGVSPTVGEKIFCLLCKE